MKCGFNHPCSFMESSKECKYAGRKGIKKCESWVPCLDEKDIAKEWIIGNEVCTPYDMVYGVPTCPTCGEVTYSMERCPFCDQLLKDPKPKCFKPEKDNPYTLCVGKYALSPANKDQELLLIEDCKDCCLFKDYEMYHEQYDERYR